MALAKICSFWTGPTLGPIHSACLQSFLAAGHHVSLFTHESPNDVPAGVEVVPATEIMPSAELRQYADKRQYETLSDFFRYRLLAASAGLWVDADCYCLRPIEDDDYIFGEETVEGLNTAVLKLPPGSPLLNALLALAPGFIPPWLPSRHRHLLALRRALGMPKPLHRLPWGTVGPAALTFYANTLGVAGRAVPSDVFYPIHWDHLDRLFATDLQLSDLVTHRTRIVHLYTSLMRRRYKLGEPPANSPLGKLIAAQHEGPVAT
jgi:hypothetical protein